MELTEGGAGALNATVAPDNATDKTVTWSSSDETVATVDQTGKVSAVAPGEAVITAKAGDKTDTCTVTVKKKETPDVPVDSITLNLSQLTLYVGDSETLTATILPEDAAGYKLTWSSLSPSIATVDENGKVTAIAPGATTVAVQAGGKTAVCTVTVKEKPSGITGVGFDKDKVSIKVGQSDNLVVVIIPDGAGADAERVFTSSNESIVTVDSNGKITGIAPGAAAITVTIGDFTATCTVTVTEKQTGNPDDNSGGSSSGGISGGTQTGDFGTPVAGLLAAAGLCAAAMVLLRKRRG